MSQPSPRQTQQQTFSPFRRRDSPRVSPWASAPRTPNHQIPSARTSPARPTAPTARRNPSSNRARSTRQTRSNRRESSSSGSSDNNNGGDVSTEQDNEYEWVDPLIPIFVFGPFVMLVYGALLFTLLGMKAWMAGVPLESILLFL
ncbi:hypothetical protein PISL3812_00778 [Talaromyces islandicus]|uniref:Uncharacterized protein n=1 Tax=Talaromyces islandicus TaxID=28573 RepID=A0A0U1LK85_TALIS|nr:hypothetical protein PISL3812_00778 [Talaromyces islandicus]